MILRHSERDGIDDCPSLFEYVHYAQVVRIFVFSLGKVRQREKASNVLPYFYGIQINDESKIQLTEGEFGGHRFVS